MKKIVALVLSLVMALSLATVAFAANYSDAYYWDEGWKKFDLNGVAISYTSPKETKEDGKVVAGSLGFYKVDNYSSLPLIEVAKADATFQMKVDGKVVYLAATDIIDYTAVGKSVKAGTKCGDYAKNEVELFGGTFPGYGKATLMEVDGDLYKQDNDAGTKAVLLDGKVVMATKEENPVKVPHEWYTLDGKVVVDWEAEELAEVKATVLCKNCKVKATVTDDKAAIPNDATVLEFVDGVYMYWTDGAADSTTTDKDGVTSAKTFDAGIAMYVGMSLLSVAGGAVVIGKKKEF